MALIALKKAFDKKNITIRFPIRTLDLGVVGGMPIHQVYPPEKMFVKNGHYAKDKQNRKVVNN